MDKTLRFTDPIFVQNKILGAYQIFWHYGPDMISKSKRIAVITIIAITPHP